jgi:hypothetical protein
MNKLNLDYGSFISRSFNSVTVSGDEVIKSSRNLEKIINEHAYFYSISDDLKHFMVQPYQLSISEGRASYRMKFWRSPDAGGLYSSKSLEMSDFVKIVDSVDSFKKAAKRNTRTTANSWNSMLQSTTIKARSRVTDFVGDRAIPLCDRLEEHILNITPYSIDSIESHGDLCLSNIILCEDGMVRFIDPRGSDSIWMDEYYDMAKLSQCILGGYDFIVNDVPENHSRDIQEYFLQYIKSVGLSYEMLRIYEASLFISMCPLHSDRPDHVEKFLDAAEKILMELGA